MPVNYFPDGFPQDASLAIESSFFLSDEEKQEWRVWLNTADENQKLELIETLHSIWTDQKGGQPSPAQPEDLNAFDNYQQPQALNELSPEYQQHQNDTQNMTVAGYVPPAPEMIYDQSDLNGYNPAPESNLGMAVQNSNVFGPVNNFNQVENPIPVANVQQPIIQPALNNIATQPVANSVMTNPELSPESITNNPIPLSQPTVPEITNSVASNQEDFDDPFDGFSFDEKDENDNFLGNFANEEIDLNKIPDAINAESQIPTPILTPIVETKVSEEDKNNNFDTTFASSDNDDIKDEVDKMLAGASANTVSNNSSINSRPVKALVDDIESDYEREMIKEKKYKKAAEVSLLSAKEVTLLYSTFIESQNKNTALEQEFQSRQAKLFDKIMEMVTEASVLSDKVLRLNDEVVNHASDLQDLKNATSVRGSTSLQNQVNALREEVRKVERSIQFSIESVDREFNDFRTEMNFKVQEMSRQLASAVADTYKADGVYEKLAKLQARLELLESSKNNSQFMFKAPQTKTINSADVNTENYSKPSKPPLSIKDLRKMNLDS
jgi:hypothetical protein